ncbi:MAG: hypothetical protein JNL08_11005 [Planctomycetes bacterium]|nr:hypothetical protein [Planctomycetota bacterium]
MQPLLLGAGLGAAFLAGQLLPPCLGGGAATLAAQGRGPTNPVPTTPKPDPLVEPRDPNTTGVVYSEESGSAAVSNNGFLAVTGSYGVGTSVLYLVDTVNRQLAVYEARGGSTEQRRIVLVGARRIDLDLRLQGYNDRSEYEYRDLERLFEKRGGTDRSVRTGLEDESDRPK